MHNAPHDQPRTPAAEVLRKACADARELLAKRRSAYWSYPTHSRGPSPMSPNDAQVEYDMTVGAALDVFQATLPPINTPRDTP